MILPSLMLTFLPVMLPDVPAIATDHGGAPVVIDAAFDFDPAAFGNVDLLVQEETPSTPALDTATNGFEPIEPFGRDGSWRWNVHGGWGAEFNDADNWLALAGFGLSHFIADGLSLDMEFNGLTIQQVDTDAAAFNFNLLFRWHFLMERTWSIYLDAGAGLLLATEEVPAGGSNFNFTPQAGVGFTLEVTEDVRLLGGVRWHHISNANTYDENPGRDSLLLYAGLTFPF